MKSSNQTLLSHPVVCRFVLLRFVGMACGLSGCVPSTAYEQASSAAEVEREGHRRAAERLKLAEAELAATRAERERLLLERDELNQRLQQEASQLAQASLDVETGRKETEQQQELVTQLRGELARVGDHMKVFAGQKSDLEQRLEETEQALTTREARIATLEGEVTGLKSNAAQATEAQNQLQDALDELSALQSEVDTTKQEGEPGDRREQDAPPGGEEPKIEGAESDNEAQEAGEVLPAEEQPG